MHRLSVPPLALEKPRRTGRGINFKSSATLSREGLVGGTKARRDRFPALRGGAVVGEHAVMFTSAGSALNFIIRQVTAVYTPSVL